MNCATVSDQSIMIFLAHGRNGAAWSAFKERNIHQELPEVEAAGSFPFNCA